MIYVDKKIFYFSCSSFFCCVSIELKPNSISLPFYGLNEFYLPVLTKKKFHEYGL